MYVAGTESVEVSFGQNSIVPRLRGRREAHVSLLGLKSKVNIAIKGEHLALMFRADKGVTKS